MSEYNNVKIIGDVFHKPDKLSKNISKNINLGNYIIVCHLFTLIGSLIYGAATGFFIGGFQIIINAIKIPIIIFALLYISLPIFYVFDIFIDNKIGIKQILTILLSGYTITALILVAFTPLVLLFSITTANVHFIVLLNTSIGTMAMFCGLFYIYQLFHYTHENGQEYMSLIIGNFIIFFSGPQILWAMRPYFHKIDTFTEPIKSNFYVEIIKVAELEPGLTGILLLFFSVVTFFIIFNLCFREKSEKKEIETYRDKKKCVKVPKRNIDRAPGTPSNSKPAYSPSMYPPYVYPNYYPQFVQHNQNQEQNVGNNHNII